MSGYQLIYCDPPWQYGNKASNGAAVNHYRTMSLTDLKRLPVWSLAAPDAVLAMWYTGNFNDEAKQLAEAWGFQVRTMKGFTWVKLNQLAENHINKALAAGEVNDFYDFLTLLNTQSRMNGGNYTRANTEDVLIAVRGNGLERLNASIKQVVYSPLGEHSEKPWEVRHRLELLYGDVKRIELFARAQAEGWDSWGNECINSLELTPAAILVESQNQQQNIPVPETGNTVWPVEVNLYFSKVPGSAELPTDLQHKILGNINRMKLDGIPSDAIIAAATTLTAAMGATA